MPGLDYASEFSFDPWTDNVDRVTASGDNGFNVRFAALEAEFQKISGAALEPGSVRSSHFELVTGTAITSSLANGISTDIPGPVVGAVPPAPALPLIAISSTTPNALFSVVTLYRMNATATQVTPLFRVQNLSGFTIQITATPYLVKP